MRWLIAMLHPAVVVRAAGAVWIVHHPLVVGVRAAGPDVPVAEVVRVVEVARRLVAVVAACASAVGRIVVVILHADVVGSLPDGAADRPARS